MAFMMRSDVYDDHTDGDDSGGGDNDYVEVDDDTNDVDGGD